MLSVGIHSCHQPGTGLLENLCEQKYNITHTHTHTAPECVLTEAEAPRSEGSFGGPGGTLKYMVH